MLAHKTNLNKLQFSHSVVKNEIITSNFFNDIRLEVNYKGKKLQKIQTDGG